MCVCCVIAKERQKEVVKKKKEKKEREIERQKDGRRYIYIYIYIYIYTHTQKPYNFGIQKVHGLFDELMLCLCLPTDSRCTLLQVIATKQIA